jgi:hypothetical protein
VQNLRSAAAGARHSHGELPKGTANGSGGAYASGSALAASPTHSQNPESQGVFLEVQGDPRGAQQRPPPRNHSAQHHRFGYGSDLRGPKAPGNARAPAGGVSRRLAEEEAAQDTPGSRWAAPRGGN